MIRYIKYFDLSLPMIDGCEWHGIECNLCQYGMSDVTDFCCVCSCGWFWFGHTKCSVLLVQNGVSFSNLSKLLQRGALFVGVARVIQWTLSCWYFSF